jgi:hypothetical protein
VALVAMVASIVVVFGGMGAAPGGVVPGCGRGAASAEAEVVFCDAVVAVPLDGTAAASARVVVGSCEAVAGVGGSGLAAGGVVRPGPGSRIFIRPSPAGPAAKGPADRFRLLAPRHRNRPSVFSRLVDRRPWVSAKTPLTYKRRNPQKG